MEIIRNNIQNNEIIKWEKYQVINYRIKIIASFILAIVSISGLLTLLSLFFRYVPSWEGTFYLLWTNIEIHPVIIYLLILSIFCSMAAVVIIYAIRLVIREIRRVNLKLSDLRSYHQIQILTNIRWIQKDFRSLLYFEENKIPPELISRIKDIVFIPLNNIEKATVRKIRSNYNIIFHFKNDLNLVQYPTFSAKFKFKDYKEIKSILNQIIPLEILED